MASDMATTHVEHLSDLRRELADWLRAHAGWPEAALSGACSLAEEAVGDGGPIEATVFVDGPLVHLYVDHCGDLDRVEDIQSGHVTVVAHDGDICLSSTY